MDLKALNFSRSQKKAAFLEKRTAYNSFTAKLDAGEKLVAEDEIRLKALDADLDALEVEIADLDAKIARAEKEARRAGVAAPAAASPTTRTRLEVSDRAANPQGLWGFRGMGDFASAVMRTSSGDIDQRLFAAPPGTNMVNQGNVGEGFLVPPDLSQSVWDLVFPGYGFDLMDLITSSPTNRNMVQLVKDETTPWGSSGVQAFWRAEASQFTASRLSLTGTNIPLHELYAFVAASQELIDDAPMLNDRLTKKAALAIRFAISKAIFQGSGVNQPLGFLNGPATIQAPKESAQAAATLVVNNVSKMFTRLPAGSIPNAIWLANIEVLPQLIQLNVGTWPVWIPSTGGMQEAPGGRLLGRPLVFTEQALPLGTPGDIMLLDPTGYYLATKAGGGVEFATSIHLFFDYNMTAFRWIFRVGGQPLLSAPIQPANGSLTKSHFVTLQQR